MNVIASESIIDFSDFADMMQLASDPVVVTRGDEALLVAMAPDVFERTLFDVNLLNCCQNRAIGYY